MSHVLDHVATGGGYTNVPFALAGRVGASVLVGILWATAPLTTSSSSTAVDGRLARAAMQTSPGLPVEPSARRGPSSALAELRRIGGLTWEQLARLFSVTRRAVHFWASGDPMSAAHEEKLHRALGVVRQIDRGSSALNRNTLFAPLSGGDTPFDLLVQNRYEDVLGELGKSLMGRTSLRTTIGRERRTYETMSPVALLEAVQDIRPVKAGLRRVAKSTRVKSGS